MKFAGEKIAAAPMTCRDRRVRIHGAGLEQRGESQSRGIGGYKVHLPLGGQENVRKNVILEKGYSQEQLIQKLLQILEMPPIREEFFEIAPRNWNGPDEDEVTIRFRYNRPKLSTLRDVTLEQFRDHHDPMAPVFLETDGACSGNPGPGGWGYVLAQGKICTRQYGAQTDTTSNKMELEALLQGLTQPFFTRPGYLVIESDSESCLHMMIEGAKIWEANCWRKVGGDVRNRAQVEEIAGRLKPLQAEFRKVAGHKGDEWNDVVDRLAVKGRDEAGGLPRCSFEIQLETGSVPFVERPMSGSVT
jgi:ribonuclease HI